MAKDAVRGARRGLQPSMVEMAVAFALLGTFLAATIPTLARNVHASRLAEPVDGLRRLGGSAIAYARTHTVAAAFPPRAPLTPATPPRGRCAVDPPEIWEHPTWTALGFLPVPLGSSHCFAFAFDSTLSPAASTFRAIAHGDLDGDGLVSTFEVTGRCVEGDPAGASLDPGMYVDSEVE